jgi:alanine-glyoxylate transaminase/(R)-3-amino-2-methylpropionate-pyruvate transaminase
MSGPAHPFRLRELPTPVLPDFPHVPQPYAGPSVEEVQRLREAHVNPAIFRYYTKPLMLVEGKGQYVFDEKGRRYLDAFGGIVTVSVGHCHPEVVAAAHQQNEILQHSTSIYLHPHLPCYASELAAKFPGDLKVVYFVNSGSEANDLALLMARSYTGHFDVIALRNGYHGGSQATMALTSHHTWKFPVPHSFGVQHAKAPDLYRGPFRAEDPEAGTTHAAEVADLLQYGTSGKIAAFIAESVQGVGGVVVFPQGYLGAVYAHVREAGGLCIADEVQAGFGRTGSHYWGFETQGVVPDIVTLAKGIGNGCPLAAVVTTPEIAASLARRIHFNTFGGNPVSMAQGRAVLRVIEQEGLQANAARMGALLRRGLAGLQTRHPLIGDVRGLGLLVGVELVKDRKSKVPAQDECARLLEHCKDLGLLLGRGGLHGNVLRITPPMCLHEGDVEFLVNVLDAALSD